MSNICDSFWSVDTNFRLIFDIIRTKINKIFSFDEQQPQVDEDFLNRIVCLSNLANKTFWSSSDCRLKFLQCPIQWPLQNFVLAKSLPSSEMELSRCYIESFELAKELYSKIFLLYGDMVAERIFEIVFRILYNTIVYCLLRGDYDNTPLELFDEDKKMERAANSCCCVDLVLTPEDRHLYLFSDSDKHVLQHLEPVVFNVKIDPPVLTLATPVLSGSKKTNFLEQSLANNNDDDVYCENVVKDTNVECTDDESVSNPASVDEEQQKQEIADLTRSERAARHDVVADLTRSARTDVVSFSAADVKPIQYHVSVTSPMDMNDIYSPINGHPFTPCAHA